MRRRYDVVQEGSTWTVGTGGPSLRGYGSAKSAISAALEAARQAERAGQHVTIYLWDRDVASKVYVTLGGPDPDTGNAVGK